MESKKFIFEMNEILEAFIHGKMGGGELVRKYDDLMADEIPDDFPKDLFKIFDYFHTEFSMYEEDETIRASRPDDYFGPDTLKTKAEELLRKACRP